MKGFLLRLREIPWYLRALVYLTFIASGTLCAVSLVFDWLNQPYAIVAYPIYAIAMLSLTYSAYLLVFKLRDFKQGLTAALKKHSFTKRLLESYDFRTLTFALISLAVSVFYTVYNATVAVMNSSLWLGIFAFYYILFSALRGVAMSVGGSERGAKLTEAVFLSVALALPVVILFAIRDSAYVTYPGITIYVSASYTFYKLTMAIINVVKASKRESYKVSLIRNINLADAAVAIFTLQIALLNTFSGNVGSGIYNFLTGIAVCLFIIGMGVYTVFIKRRLLSQKGGAKAQQVQSDNH